MQIIEVATKTKADSQIKASPQSSLALLASLFFKSLRIWRLRQPPQKRTHLRIYPSLVLNFFTWPQQ